MFLCIDIGNTNTVLAVTEQNKICQQWRIRSEKNLTIDELRGILSGLFQMEGISAEAIKIIIISSVVPALTRIFKGLALNYFHITPLIVSHKLDIGMPVQYDNLREIGADRLVNAVGAYKKYLKPLVVIDFGTATTFDYISGEGEYQGGAIAPGMMIALDALFQNTSKLPRIEDLALPEKIIAKNTIDSINSGVIYGYAGLVDGIVKRIKQEAGGNPLVIATGGLAPLICDVCQTIDQIDKDLTIEGLMIIAGSSLAKASK